MRALIVTPAREGALTGNRRTALRWAELLARLGHVAQVAEEYQGQPCDLMIGLHAARSAVSIARFRAARPADPLILALTGTDLYRDLERSDAARRSLELATRFVALQPLAVEKLAEDLRPRVRVILQSAVPLQAVPTPLEDRFEICVLGQLRPVKDPFRTAEAVRLLPADSRVQVLHAGVAQDPELERRARVEAAANPRYRWLGALAWEDGLRLLARSRLLVLTSIMEGGANVIGEAVVHGVAVISSAIDGSIGLLGADYPGYFPVGDTVALAGLIRRCETDAAFLAALRRRCRTLADDFSPQREIEAWRELLAELFPV